MNTTKNRLLSLAGALALGAALSGCYTLDHRVGTGAQGGSESEERQWYILFGLIPLNEVDSHEMAAGAANYDVNSQISALDVILNLFTGWVTIYSQTVTVTK
jgi:hypothetical protein